MNLKNFPKRLDSKTSSLRIAVPENLDLALEGLIRKVLREQPKTDDIYAFAADYFETLLKIRDKTGAKFTATQLCPFHNDEDAHEMIKLAGTFTKPAKLINDEKGKMKKPVKVANTKTNKSTKPKESVKDKQQVKQATPDLIKKLPTVTRPGAEVESKTQTNNVQGHDSEEATPEKEEEFLTSDPIKELVEKELMMEANTGKNKTDGNEKTDNQNIQEEETEKPLENVTIDNEQTHEEKKEENKETETKEKAENEKTETELSKTSEAGTKDAETTENALDDRGAKDAKEKTEETDKEVTKPNGETSGKTQKEKEGEDVTEEKDVKEVEKVSEAVTELPKTVESQRNDKKESNKKIETFPVSESKKKVMDVLPSEKLPEISEDITEKNPDALQTETEAEQESRNVEKMKPIQDDQTASAEPKIPETAMETIREETETQDNQQPNDNLNIEAVQETTASIPEHKSPDLSLETDVTSNEEKENQKTEEAKPASNKNDAQPTGDNEQTHTDNQEKEAEIEKETEKHKNNLETASQVEETTAEESKPEKSLTVNEDATFGEIIKNNEEEETTEEDIKTNEGKPEEDRTEKITPAEGTKPEENQKPEEHRAEKIIPTEETKAEEKQKPEEDRAEKIIPAEETKSEEKQKQEEDKTEKITPAEENQKPEEDRAEKIIPAEETKAEGKQKPEESTKPTVSIDKPADANERIEDIKGEEHIKPITENNHKPADASESTQMEDKTPETSDSGKDTQTGETEQQEEEKQETTKTEMDNQETETKTDIPLGQPETPETPQQNIPTVHQEELKTTSEASTTEVQENIDAEVSGGELCSVVDNKAPKDDTATTEKPEGEPEPDRSMVDGIQTVEVKTEDEELVQTKDEKETEELCTVVDVPKEGETVTEERVENMETEQAEELCRVVDNPKVEATDEARTESETEKREGKEENTDSEKPSENSGKSEESTTELTNSLQTDNQHIIRVEEVEMPTKPDEIQIKTIQTHYYDTLQVPEAVTREYRVHNMVPQAGLLGAANILLDENMNTTLSPEPLDTVSSQVEETVPTAVPTEQVQGTDSPVLPLDLETQTPKTDSDDLLDLMTPTSGYSMNLSDVSLLTVSELFLDSEKRYSSLEKEEIRYVTPKTNETADESREEVEEVIVKTVLPSQITAVPVPPREAEEINEETNLQTTENVKEEKKEEGKPEEKKVEDKPEEKKEEDKPEDKPESDSTESSSNGRSVDSDIPFISVEVKTVIETQVLDDEEEKNGGEHPEVEVEVRATIDIQHDDVSLSQPEQIPVEEGSDTSEEKSQEKPEEKSSAEAQSRDEEKQETFSAGVEGSSSLESDMTGSSAATEIKRTDSSKRNLGSVRSLVSAQSLDLEKRNPLLKTRSLSSFRHGVTDFEVWNKIEKELEDAAIKIQSKFRGYKTRKKLRRENAVQITTEESSVSTTPVEAEAQGQQQSTGEFHDSIVLSEHPR